MNILMMTNTYKPILGGLERSVESFTEEFRRLGHRAIIVAPEYEGMQPEMDVIRIPALQKFNGTDFSVQLPIPGVLTEALGGFKPDIVHAHHPFLVGDTALRIASKYNVPLVFTHHILFEENVHYMPGDEKANKKFIVELATGFANLADQVFAPSQSVLQLMKDRGVETPIAVVPTGIWLREFSRGAGKAFRKKQDIPQEAFVIGHLGRLALEKNLDYLSKVVFKFLQENKQAYFLVAGQGPYMETLQEIAVQRGVAERLRLLGSLKGKDKTDAYYAMDVFAFASQSETQGIVLTEALACRIPIVAVDACGVRDLVQDKVNGRLLENENLEDFLSALRWVEKLSPERLDQLKKACRQTARELTMEKCAAKALSVYSSLLVRQGFIRRPSEDGKWAQTRRVVQTQGGLVKNLTKAAKTLVAATFNKNTHDDDL